MPSPVVYMTPRLYSAGLYPHDDETRYMFTANE